MVEREYIIKNGVKKLRRFKDYTIDELRQRLLDHFATLDRQHGRKPRVLASEAVYQDEAKEKRRLWNNYRSIISRQDRKDTLKWQDEMRNKTLNNTI